MLRNIILVFGILGICSGCSSSVQTARYEYLKAWDADLKQRELSAAHNAQDLYKRYEEASKRGDPVDWIQTGGDLYEMVQWIKSLSTD